MTYIASSFQTPIHLKSFPNIDQYLMDSLVKFQLQPTIGFGVMLNSVKLDGRKFDTKIRIQPCLGRITKLNRIIIDGGSCSNVASETLVKKLNIKLTLYLELRFLIVQPIEAISRRRRSFKGK